MDLTVVAFIEVGVDSWDQAGLGLLTTGFGTVKLVWHKYWRNLPLQRCHIERRRLVEGGQGCWTRSARDKVSNKATVYGPG